jgi:serine/threonine protein kinase
MRSTLKDTPKCPSCGKPLPAGVLAGLCPSCLLAQGAETERVTPGPQAQFEPPAAEEIAKLFPQLEIVRLLGAGGMGAVYQARQPALDRTIALKILPATTSTGANFAERFNREARALARLSHPNIVAVHEFGQVGKLHFFIMEFVDGANLRQLEKAGRLSPREALQIIPQICDALQYAHDEGVVHRDIKPENVLVDRKGRVKIADFGLAKILGVDAESLRLTAEGQVMGTPHYMAPEQVERPLAVDHRADIYSLGVVFYEMLTGDLPLGKFSPPSRKVEVDVRLDEVVLRALENDPARRYQQASQIKSRVETIATTPTASDIGRKRAWWLDPRVPAVVILLFAVSWVLFQSPWSGSITGQKNTPFEMLRSRSFGSLFKQKRSSVGIAEPLDALRSPDTGVFTANLSDGGTMTLLAVSDSGSTANAWWRPDGSPITNVAFETRGLADLAAPGARKLDLAFRVSGHPPKANSSVFEFEPDTYVSLGGDVFENGKRIADGWSMRVAHAPSLLTATFRFGTPMGSWRKVMSRTPTGPPIVEATQTDDPVWPSNVSLSNTGPGLSVSILLSPDAYLSNDGAQRQSALVPGTHARNWRLRVVVLDQKGVPHLMARTSEDGPETEVWTNSTWTLEFPGMTLERMKEVRVEVQRIAWVEFADVALHPRGILKDSQGTEMSMNPPDQFAWKNGNTGALTAQIPGGGTVELLAMGEPNAAPHGWWTPDGTPVEQTTFAVQDICEVRDHPEERQKDMIFRFRQVPKSASGPLFEFIPAAASGAGGAALQEGRELDGGWPVRVAWPRELNFCTVRIGFALAEWKPLVRFEPISGSSIRSPQAGGPDWEIVHHGSVNSTEGAKATLVFGKEDRRWKRRLVAVDTNGVEYAHTDESTSASGKSSVWTYTFRDVPLYSIAELRVEARPVHWIEFRDIALAPRTPVPGPRVFSYGPVLERKFDGLLDLDTGELGEFPTRDTGRNLAEGVGQNIAWMQERGFDAEARADELGLVGTTIAALDGRDWDSLTPGMLGYHLRDSGAKPTRLVPIDGRLPATFGFRTREGGSGILQIIAFGGQRPGATLRYKLVTQRDSP